MPTLDQEYAQYQGQSVLVSGADPSDRGQCVQWADYVIHDVYGQPYVWLNAIDWWNQFASTPQLANNFVQLTDGTIKKGDFVIFNSLVGSVYGHIDVAMADGSYNQFTGSDTNWAGNLTVHQVNHVGSQYIQGVLRLKGGTNMPISTDNLYSLIRGLTGREPTLSEVTNQTYLNDPNAAIATFWNNGGANRYANHSEAQFQQLATARDNVEKIADTRFNNEKAVADLVGVSNPDDTNSVVAKVKELQANQGGTNPTVLAPGVYKVQ